MWGWIHSFPRGQWVYENWVGAIFAKALVFSAQSGYRFQFMLSRVDQSTTTERKQIQLDQYSTTLANPHLTQCLKQDLLQMFFVFFSSPLPCRSCKRFGFMYASTTQWTHPERPTLKLRLNTAFKIALPWKWNERTNSEQTASTGIWCRSETLTTL